MAITQLERATTLEPGFALAHVGLARAYFLKHMTWDPRKEWHQKASLSLEKALSIDSRSAEAYVARALLEVIRWKQFPIEEAVNDLRRALAINSNLSDAHYTLGVIYLEQTGLLEKALDEFKAAVAVDPENLEAHYRIPRVYLYQQKYELALSEFARVEFSPNWQKALALSYLGRTREAFEFIEALRRDFPTQEDVASTYAVLLAAAGENKRAEAQIRIAIHSGQDKLHFHHAEYNIASAYALMGNKRLAIQWLRKTAEDGLNCYPLFDKDPHLNNLRDDSEFRAFMKQMRVQWEQYKATL